MDGDRSAEMFHLGSLSMCNIGGLCVFRKWNAEEEEEEEEEEEKRARVIISSRMSLLSLS
jgi:CO dehydrogenase/acetyl-CoA synthase beta subunit